MLLGTVSVAIALFEPHHGGVQSGFLVSTIGVTAIVSGVHAVRRARWGSATARAFGRGGAILGAVGSALMLYALLAFGLGTAGVVLPPLSLSPLAAPATDAPTSIGVAEALPSSAAAPVVPQGSDEAATTDPTNGAAATTAERTALMQSAGSMAYAVGQRYPQGAYPAEMTIDPAVPTVVRTSDGFAAASVPAGTRVLYSVAADGSSWSVTLIGAAQGTVATYSSAVGIVKAG